MVSARRFANPCCSADLASLARRAADRQARRRNPSEKVSNVATQSPSAESDASRGILFILVATFCISLNDVMIKSLSGGYPLHETVFVRSAIGILFSLVFVQFEGGWRILKTDRPGLHLLRGLLIVVSNMTYFAALAAMPLADATALFFVAPLLITLLSIPLLGEKVGPRRLAAVAIGFVGVLIMLAPWQSEADVPVITRLLPIVAALTYALMQIMTRKLGVTTKASAMAVYIQSTFLMVSAAFFLVAGDGRFAEGLENESLIFLLRAWRWPEGDDWWIFIGLGLNAGIIGYTISAAYRMAQAATVAPFEYLNLPLAILWGWLVWEHLPGERTAIGIALILGAGVYVFLRERRLNRPVAARRPLRRHH